MAIGVTAPVALGQAAQHRRVTQAVLLWLRWYATGDVAPGLFPHQLSGQADAYARTPLPPQWLDFR